MDGLASRPSGNNRPLRAGGRALTLLSSTLNLEALRRLGEEPRQLQELMRLLGFPPRSTTRLHLQALADRHVVERRARSEFPTSVDYEITEAGRALLEVAECLQAWLSRSPAGPVELGSTAARSAIKALVEGWGSNVVRPLATRPLALTELDSLIPRISYPSLERRLTAMRQVGLLTARRRPGRASPYEVTPWLREAVAPLLLGAGWERRYAADSTPDLRRLDAEAAFLLVVPAVELPTRPSGSCRLALEAHDGVAPVLGGVVVGISGGRVVSCVADLDAEAEASVSGDTLAWLQRLRGGAGDKLEIGGKRPLAEAMLMALSEFGTPPQ